MTLNKMFSSRWFCAVLCTILLFGNSAYSQSKVRYVTKYKETAIAIMNETGIPASIILGIAMLESGMGTSKNARLLHNHFGIVGKNKLHKKKGGTYRSRYREFESDDASFRYFAKMVQKKKYYPLMKGDPKYKDWLKHMNDSGYSAAGQVWEKRVAGMISRYKLYKLDEQMAYSKK
ncbi:glucosaminidase domain-containing protein [Chitinophaga sancti]|uniref:Flagellum-specific peptidoglycan hydrolase FlgJ n=1 Tax=Chitinophaga sancti TaxID=1004 RepID=A0A1K1S9A0_9BACT|nr:glucosaminidase domain-containing protein [Chitinophaga sancti]WQD60923.1 glucosaminidase domain-containing protein [Chitinophaga sancti]WQG86949.1 glucosaminidase domain-containing protein [Chitinophaga sancti]SFW80961.1 Flagellum-specific peptidoglycan hydrolase FlgJ [Chitinophaga sancti]